MNASFFLVVPRGLHSRARDAQRRWREASNGCTARARPVAGRTPRLARAAGRWRTTVRSASTVGETDSPREEAPRGPSRAGPAQAKGHGKGKGTDAAAAGGGKGGWPTLAASAKARAKAKPKAGPKPAPWADTALQEGECEQLFVNKRRLKTDPVYAAQMRVVLERTLDQPAALALAVGRQRR